MFVKFILPARTEATNPLFRPIRHSLFPPLGLATLAAYLDAADHAEMRGMGRIWQGADTVNSLSESATEPGLLEKAAASGLRSLFVGFESTNQEALRSQRKFQNLNRDYSEAIRRLHGQGIMVNGSFVFGMDQSRHASLPTHAGTGAAASQQLGPL